jgi:hypothetical protein
MLTLVSAKIITSVYAVEEFIEHAGVSVGAPVEKGIFTRKMGTMKIAIFIIIIKK